RVQLESRSLWDFYHLDEGIARDVRNAAVAEWDEAYLFDCLAWLYDGFAVPALGPRLDSCIPRPLKVSIFRQLWILFVSHANQRNRLSMARHVAVLMGGRSAERAV